MSNEQLLIVYTEKEVQREKSTCEYYRQLKSILKWVFVTKCNATYRWISEEVEPVFVCHDRPRVVCHVLWLQHSIQV